MNSNSFLCGSGTVVNPGVGKKLSVVLVLLPLSDSKEIDRVGEEEEVTGRGRQSSVCHTGSPLCPPSRKAAQSQPTELRDCLVGEKLAFKLEDCFPNNS